jgi:carboxymethylenebutenolidase
MKKLSFLLFFLAIGKGVWAQSPAACCHQDATTEFANLASREDFRMAHENPLPYTYQGTAGSNITFPTPDGQEGHGFLFKAATPSNKYLYVIHEWYGLNDFVKKECEKLYDDLGKKVNVIAIDLYDQKVATNREDAGKLMQAVKTERAVNIIKGAFNYAPKDAAIATLGWCFGGGWSLQAAMIAGPRAVACVMYYGMPEKEVATLKTLHAPVLGIFANKDKFITPQVVETFEKNMKEAGKSLVVKQYDADHGFANPSNPIYDSNATKEAYSHVLPFLKKYLE